MSTITPPDPTDGQPLVTLMWWDNYPHAVNFRTDNPLWKAHYRRLVDQGLKVRLQYRKALSGMELVP